METLQLLHKKIRLVLPIIVIVSAVVFFYKFFTTPKTAARADEYGVSAKITSKQTETEQNKPWVWNIAVTAEKHIGEQIPMQIGVYRCDNASNDICRPESDDFSETVLFQSYNFLVRETNFTTAHSSVACGRVQIQILTNGIDLGSHIQNTNIPCQNAEAAIGLLANQETTSTNNQKNWETFGALRALTCITTGVDCPEEYTDPEVPIPRALLTPEPTPDANTPPGSTPSPSPTPIKLDYIIDFRDSAIVPGAGAKEFVECVWSRDNKPTKDYWDTIKDQSIANGWNPTLLLALWNEETGASLFTKKDNGGYCDGEQCSLGHLGCGFYDQSIDGRDGKPGSLSCVFDNFAEPRIPKDDFALFMQKYSGEPVKGEFHGHHNFVKNLKIWYDCLANFQMNGANPDCPQVKRCL